MWEEEKHPRDNDGKFTEKSGGNRGDAGQVDRARQTLNRLINDYKKRVNLSKVEWKKFFNKIAEVQYGGYAEKLNSGNVAVTIEHDNIHTIIVYNGSFVSPIVSKTIKVNDEKSKAIKSIMDYLKESYYE